MEQRRLFAIGVEGPPVEGWVSEGGSRGAVFIGAVRRREDDGERALRFALRHVTPAHRMVIKELEFNVEANQPKVDWQASFGSDFRLLQEGEILVAPEIARFYSRIFLFEHVVEDGTELFFLRGLRRRPARLVGFTPDYAQMVGRKAELDRFEELLEQISIDQGQICGVVGEAGVGKTRLTIELRKHLKDRAIPFLISSYSAQSEGSLPAFRQLITSLTQGKVENLSRWNLAQGEIDFLRMLIEPHRKIEQLSGFDDEQIRQGLFSSVRKLIHAASAHPLAIILEDLHRYDAEALELLDYVMEGMESTKLLLVLTYRPELTPSWSQRLNFNELLLRPFDAGETTGFLKTLLNVDRVAQKFAEELYRLSLGNPLFVEELLRQLFHEKYLDVVTQDDGTRLLRVKEHQLSALPTTLHSLIGSRFDRLDFTEKEILRWATVFGLSFELGELLEFLRKDLQLEVGDRIQHLVEAAYLKEMSAFPVSAYQFTHDLIYEVVRSSVSELELKNRNGVVGRFLSKKYAENYDQAVDRIATHFLQGDDDQVAIRSALQAGNVANSLHQFPRALYFHKEAARRWERLRPETPTVGEIYPPLTRSLLSAGHLDRAREAIAKWKKMGVAKTSESEGALARLEMSYYQARSEFADAMEASDRAMKSLKSVAWGAEDHLTFTHDRAHILFSMGKPGVALAEAREVLDQPAADLNSMARLRLDSLATLCATVSGNQAVKLRPQEALQRLEETHERAARSASPKVRLETALQAAQVFARFGRFDTAISLSAQMIELAQTAGLRQELARGIIARGLFKAEVGEYTQALSDLEKALEEAYAMKNRSLEVQALATMALTNLDIGALDDAEALRLETSSPSFRNLDPWQKARQWTLRSYFKEMRNEWEEARLSLQAAADIYEQIGDRAREEEVKMQRLCIDAQARLRPLRELVSSFEELAVSKQNLIYPSWGHQRNIASYVLGALGGKLSIPPDKGFDPSVAPGARLKQRLYVAKLGWLKSVGNKAEWKKLRNAYKMMRSDLEMCIPTKYHQEFHKHPLFGVPK